MRGTVVAMVVLLALPVAAARGDARLGAPARPSATAITVAGSPAVRLRWHDTARGETRWEVRRGAHRVAVLRANTTRYTDRHVPAGARYRYPVRPCRHHRGGRWTRHASVRIAAAPAPPSTPPPPGA